MSHSDPPEQPGPEGTAPPEPAGPESAEPRPDPPEPTESAAASEPGQPPGWVTQPVPPARDAPAEDPGATVRMDPADLPAPEPDPADTPMDFGGSAPPAPPAASQPDPSATVRLDPRELPSEPDPGATVRMDPADLPSGDAIQEAAALAEAAAAAEVTEAADDPLIGTLIRNKWRVLKRLGAGSFGTVYKVEDVKGGWIEALKILGIDRLTGADAEEMRARFLREAQIMKRLGTESQHIVGLGTYEEDIEAGLIYFLMEFVEGRSLADALHEEGPFSVERTIRLAKQACEALVVAHEGPEPVVHRDLKLENLMLTKDRSGAEIVKILDFGIAKIAEKEADSRLTTVGTLGTPGYAAPEQLRAEGVDGRTDLFAFGVILYALLTGRDPWLGGLAHEPTHQIYELMVATDRGEVRPINQAGVTIPAGMTGVIMKLLRRNPDQRYQSARELLAALEEVERGGGQAEAGAIRVLTTEPGVHVEVRSGREVVAEGPTPCVANGLAAGTYTLVVRDPLFAESETTFILGEGAIEDVTLQTSRRADPERRAAAPPRRKSRKGLRAAAAVLFVLALGGSWYAQPWGRTLDRSGLDALVADGRITAIWVVDGGVEGGVAVAPSALLSSAPMLAQVQGPFYVPIDEGDLPELVSEMTARGVQVDATWEILRLRDLAVGAQEAGRYFGVAGGDVRSYALRLREMDPGNEDAASLLRKVGERLAWEADVARVDGPPGRAEELLSECRALVPDHPRCVESSEAR